MRLNIHISPLKFLKGNSNQELQNYSWTSLFMFVAIEVFFLCLSEEQVYTIKEMFLLTVHV